MGVKRWILLLLFVCSMPLARGQDEKFKALFMYNFTKYLEWPGAKKSGNFRIAVLGNSPIISELQTIATKKTVENQKIEVVKLNEIGAAVDCHILFIPAGRSYNVEEIKSKLAGKAVVIITDSPGAAKDFSGINYVKQDGKQSFEINKKHLDSQGVMVNSNLISLGVRVE